MDSRPTTPDAPLTRHALRRRAQRGVALEIAPLLVEHADLSLHAGNGCVSVSVRLGRDAAAMLVAQGIHPDAVDRARRLVALFADRGVVTVLGPRAGPRYRQALRVENMPDEIVDAIAAADALPTALPWRAARAGRECRSGILWRAAPCCRSRQCFPSKTLR